MQTPQIDHTFTPKPALAGYYIINGAKARLQLTIRPNIIRRFLCKLLLDWHWEEA